MINFNPDVTAAVNRFKGPGIAGPAAGKTSDVDGALQSKDAGNDFTKTIKAVEKYISQVDQLQQASELSIKDLLAGKTDDISSVVSTVAKADMSFKLLVGVRNKLIEAYKETMNMPL